MMNSLSQSLVTNPHKISVIPTVKAVNRAVTPPHQTSSQSNTYSAQQQHNQVPSFPSADRENEFIPTMSIAELEKVVTTSVR
ncbi:MAG: hypothetical protein HRT53_13995 [Colwellia sp.]|nr:hypothetical protein [Colwellia sp.]